MNLNLEIVNKDSKDIKKNVGNSYTAVTITERGFYFTKSASKLFGFGDGKYLHLVRGKDDKKRYNGHWYFVVNDDEKGFKMTRSSHDAFIVFNKPALRLFKMSVKCETGDMFYLSETESTLNDCPVIEIMVSKTVQQILKDN